MEFVRTVAMLVITGLIHDISRRFYEWEATDKFPIAYLVSNNMSWTVESFPYLFAW